MSQFMSQPILYLEGTPQEEADFDFRRLFPESCGLAAAIDLPCASRYVYDCLVLQEHRGEHSVGIVSREDRPFREDRQFHLRRRVGVVREQFLGVDFEDQLPGTTAIGHNRYATCGDPDAISNIQPLFFCHTRYGPFAIAHNGTLLDREGVRQRLIQEGVLFQSSTDSELLGHLLARSHATCLEEAMIEATRAIPAAYSLLIFSEDRVLALRDRFGVRPLSLAALDGGFLVCSENYTFDQYPSGEHLGEIHPGEMVIFERGKSSPRRLQYAEPDEHFCVFEGIYFSDPRSRYHDYWHEDFRYELGRRLFEEHPGLGGDLVLPVLDSGKHAALGLSEASGVPYREYFKRLHNPPRAGRRSFTSATTAERVRTAYQKLHLRQEKIRDQHVVVVDDSIVRATTMRLINQRLRQAGAASITNCISAPPIVDVCPFGMDYQERTQLVAYHHTLHEIEEKIGADRLLYLSLDGLQQVVQRTYHCGTCSGCFGGRYAACGENQRPCGDERKTPFQEKR